MKLDSVGDVIATRKLFLAHDRSRQITVKMGKPQSLPEALGDDSFCPIQITGIGAEKIRYAAGVDAFQAIELGLKLIGVELEVLNREYEGQLRWECDEHGLLGFPAFPESAEQ